VVGSAAAGRWLIVLALAGEGGPPAEPTMAPPSEELLLFLAEFSDAQGHYVDPASVEAATEPTDETTKSTPSTERSDSPAVTHEPSDDDQPHPSPPQ
jgi:hypothetical protein